MSQMNTNLDVKDYYNRFDADNKYDFVLVREGYGSQGSEINEMQSTIHDLVKNVGDAILSDGDVIRDPNLIIDADTGLVRADSGAVYLKGAVRGVPPREFTVPTSGTVAIGVRLRVQVVSELEDPGLRNPAKGSRGEGLPGAWRLQVLTAWGWDGDGEEGDFFPVYAVDDGQLRSKEAPPVLDSFSQTLARYDRDSTGGGSYIVRGLRVLRAADNQDGRQVYTIAEGGCRVNGYSVELPTSRRVVYDPEPDYRLISTEVHLADDEDEQRITVSHPPLANVTDLRITAKKTVEIRHGAYTGVTDALPDTSVVSILEVRQGDTVYSAGTDYLKNGDALDWSPLGEEPATGSTYEVTYTYMCAAEAEDPDEDGFTVSGAHGGTSILVSYRQMVPRFDRLALNQDGEHLWVRGVASEYNARPPEVPVSLLTLATIHQTWRADDGNTVNNDGIRVSSFSDFEQLNKKVDWLTLETARNRLESDMGTRESGGRAGLFVDPLLDDSMRDQGLPQTAAVVNGSLMLPISATPHNVSDDVLQPTSLPYVVRTLLDQPYRTGSMLVNPYMAFDPLPGTVDLVPDVDRWMEQQTVWTSDVTRQFETGHWVPGNSTLVWSTTTTSTETVGVQTSKLEYLRSIDVKYTVEGFGPGEILDKATFDGVLLNLSGTADEDGVLRGILTIPEKSRPGQKPWNSPARVGPLPGACSWARAS